MNLKSTIALLVLALAAAALIWKGPDLAPKVGLAPKPLPEAKGNTALTLQKLVPGEITSISVHVPGSTPVKFMAAQAGKPLELPGNWPARRNEVEELVAVLSSLNSRFQPVPLGKDEEGNVFLKGYGLAPSQNPVVVEVLSKGETVSLAFGEAPLEPGANPFTRPAFVRVGNEMELLRLGPDILPVLRRSSEFYRKRQLFPDATRVKVADSLRSAQEALPQFILGDAVSEISIQGPQGKYVLKRVGPSPKPQPPIDKPAGDAVVLASHIAEAWQITEPVQDRADPAKLKAILATIPDLWVEQFVFDQETVGAFSSVIGGVVESIFQPDGPFMDISGLRTPANRITLTLTNGATRTLLLGQTTRMNVRTEPAPPPPFPMAPPQPPKIIEEKYYFAKLADNPLVFEVKGDKLADVFLESKADLMAKTDPPGPAFSQLRDPSPARFETDQVTDITITRAGQTLELHKTKGDPKAESEAGRKDRWDLVAPFKSLAEAKQVSDLLDPLEKLSAKANEVIDRPTLHLLTGSLGMADLAAAGLTPDQATVVKLKSDPKAEVPDRTITIGRQDVVGKKMIVLGPGPNRLNIIEDAAFTAVARPPRAYRALKLFDLGDDRLEAIVVQGEKNRFRLQENVGTTSTTFVLTEPVKAEAETEKSRSLLKDLGSLEATEYVYDPPSAAEAIAIRTLLGGFGEELLKATEGAFGMEKPSAVVTLNFAGPKPMAPRTLTIGKTRDGKPEAFAKLDGSPSVFAIKKEVADALTGGSLALLPLQLWNGSGDGLKTVQIKRGADPEYTLKQEASKWKITAPIDAAADEGAVLPIATVLSAMKADKFAAHAATNLAEYGLDKPVLTVKFTLTERKVNKPGDEPKDETKERTLLVGKPENEGKTRFAKLAGDGEPAVFVIADAAFKDLDKPALELLSKKLLSVPPTTVTQLQLTGPDGVLVLTKEGNEWKPVGATFPVDVPTVDSLLRIISNLNALKFADYGDAVDWAKYGLDANSKPQTLGVLAGPLPHKLELGKVVEGTPNDRYVRVDGGKGVAVLPVTVTRDLSKGKLDLVERTIFKFDPIDLQAIRRSMGGQEFEAVLEGTNWAVTKPSKMAADVQGLEELSDRLGALRADRVVDVEGKDLAKYGLDKPTAIVKLELIGKGAKTIEKALKIGSPVDPAKPEGERFAQAEGATTVIAISGLIAKKLLAEPIKFRDRALANFVTADKIIITRNGKDVTFLKTGGNWKLKEPLETDAEDEALRELHDGLARLRAEEIVAEKPADLKTYGLDNGERWKLFNGEKEVLNLLVGSREKIGEPGKEKTGFRAYGKLDKGDLVVLLDMALSAKLGAEYRKRVLWEQLDVAQATSIEFETPQGPGSFRLMKGPIGWMDPLSLADRISQEAATEFLDVFAGLKAERFIEHAGMDFGKLYGLDPAQKKVTVTTQSGQKRTLLLGRTDELKRVYARPEGKDRKEVVVLSEKDTITINRDRSGFLATGKKETEPKKELPKKE